jgi:probable F420-dependent oxidoreductase
MTPMTVTGDSDNVSASSALRPLRVDAGIWCAITETGDRARELESIGYDGIYVPETGHDPFLPIAAAAQTTARLQLRTGVAIAFPRSPTHLAMVANDLHLLSKGRFQLGLGSQVKSHIERRFATPWSDPIGQMRDLVGAIRALFTSWNDRARLDFHSDHYTLTLMTPFFSPDPNPYGAPPIFLAALGPRMTEVAGEVADGVLPHGLSTTRYFREVTLPALERGLAKAGRQRSDVELCCPNLIATGDNDAELDESLVKLRQHLAFYASTPTYRGVLDLHGLGDLQRDLHQLTVQNRWAEMGALITDDVLEVFTVVGTPDAVATKIIERASGLADRVSFFSPAPMSLERTAFIVDAIKRSSRRAR